MLNLFNISKETKVLQREIGQFDFCKIGLTGGIGSGKSTVAKSMVRHGWCVIDADAVSREVTAANGVAIGCISQTFGEKAIDANGAMDRVYMRELIFRNPSAKVQLERLLHPLIQWTMLRHTLVYLRKKQIENNKKYPIVVYDVPLLLETTFWNKFVNVIIVVDCEPATQIQRVIQRSQLSQATVQAIIDTQMARHERLKYATYVIQNGQGVDLNTLQAQVSGLIAEIEYKFCKY